jgi:transcriptional regulator of arginine metabolism
MDEINRYKILSELLRTKQMANQRDVVEALKQAGYETTQSSVSRDMKKLGVIKYEGFYRLPQTERSDLGASMVMSMASAGPNLMVLKTSPGIASRVALNIDIAFIAGVVGTIAGDDTIFIAIADNYSHTKITRAIQSLFQ